MNKDLPECYDMMFGSMWGMLSDAHGRDEIVYAVAVDVEGKTEMGTTGSPARFFSKGDYRRDAVDVAMSSINRLFPEKASALPKEWKDQVLGTQEHTLSFEGEDISLVISAASVKRFAEIALDVDPIEPQKDEKTRNLILTRNEFLNVFQSHYGRKLLDACKSCFSSNSGLPQPPDKEGLAKVLEKAGELFDLYTSFPVGSLMVTKDFIFPYGFGRKQFENFQWRHALGDYCHEGRLPTIDRAVQFTGVDTDIHTMENPVFTANTFKMDVVEDTYLVPKNQERTHFIECLESLGEFKSIWMQNPPLRHIPKGATPPRREWDWHPKKDEFIQGVCNYLEIK